MAIVPEIVESLRAKFETLLSRLDERAQRSDPGVVDALLSLVEPAWGRGFGVVLDDVVFEAPGRPAHRIGASRIPLDDGKSGAVAGVEPASEHQADQVALQ